MTTASRKPQLAISPEGSAVLLPLPRAFIALPPLHHPCISIFTGDSSCSFALFLLIRLPPAQSRPIIFPGHRPSASTPHFPHCQVRHRSPPFSRLFPLILAVRTARPSASFVNGSEYSQTGNTHRLLSTGGAASPLAVLAAVVMVTSSDRWSLCLVPLPHQPSPV